MPELQPTEHSLVEESPDALTPNPEASVAAAGDLSASGKQADAMKIIAVTNIKGGVGKTTTAVNLSYLCAASSGPTLLWDLDPQGAATYTLRGDPVERATPKKLLNGKRHLPELILSTGYPNLDLLPADFSYRNFDVHLAERKRPTERLLKMSRSLREVYSVLFLDCAPGISLLSENVLHAADAIIVPLLPTPLSVRMLVQLQDFIAGKGWTDLMVLPFFSMVDRRKSLHHEIIAKTREQFPTILATEVPYSSEIERMSLRRAPIPAFAPRSAAAQIYSALWAELMSVWPGHPAFPALAERTIG
ncbi:MAG TPA: ParA family protein [Steroidobacteraceae bacterium]|jgi:chromosome partitioning protein|nr:ParA family protein [Steroidobacteraceae bacterium]